MHVCVCVCVCVVEQPPTDVYNINHVDPRLTLFSRVSECVDIMAPPENLQYRFVSFDKFENGIDSTSEPQGFVSNSMTLCPVYYIDYFVSDLILYNRLR